jgi:gliding motility-associated-like protein
VNPFVSTEYIFEYTDSLGCIYPNIFIDVIVLNEFTLDVPKAFTPNGDGINDIVYVRGWGIKELLEFRIYNRWGQEIFYTEDINQGWDGTFLGKLQNIDTYAYYVKARFFNNAEKDKKGTINLLR